MALGRELPRREGTSWAGNEYTEKGRPVKNRERS